MRRRDFLYNTGLLIPALLAAPARLLASQKPIKTDILIIQTETGAFNLPIEGRQLTGKEISHLEYSQEGFLITTNDNTLLLASKIIMHSSCRVNVQRSSMEINTGRKTFHLNFASANDQHITVPEFWFLKKEQFLASKTKHFINRNRHVLLCLSGA
jgi:hypothetical protein